MYTISTLSSLNKIMNIPHVWCIHPAHDAASMQCKKLSSPSFRRGEVYKWSCSMHVHDKFQAVNSMH